MLHGADRMSAPVGLSVPKYEFLGRVYELEDFVSPSAETMQPESLAGWHRHKTQGRRTRVVPPHLTRKALAVPLVVSTPSAQLRRPVWRLLSSVLIRPAAAVSPPRVAPRASASASTRARSFSLRRTLIGRPGQTARG